ncbi:MAG TPA: type III pantothenate kinase [Planctomycetota bacterium]|jgi:type III pantothenate kinase|nr:type III pantothenate kinase [Planctomycetota bacterium]
MLLAAVDLGNSRLHAAVFAETPSGILLVDRRDAAAPSSAFFRKWRVPVAEAVYASVRPEADRALERAIQAGWKVRARKMGRDFPAAIRNRTRKPGETGGDRLANAVAAWHRCRRVCIVVDMGTAITVEVVNRKGEFVGGAIAPGLAAMAGALHDGTNLLPLVPPHPRADIGRDTKSSIEAGLYAAGRGMIGIGRHLAGGPARLFGTGGDAKWFASLFDEVVPDLTLEGVALSWLKARRP